MFWLMEFAYILVETTYFLYKIVGRDLRDLRENLIPNKISYRKQIIAF